MSTHDADKIRKPKDTIRLIFHKRNDSLTLKVSACRTNA